MPTVTTGSLAGTDTGAFTQTFDTKNVGTGKTLTPAGTVSDGNGGANYTITFANDTTGVITARADHRHRHDRHQGLRRDHQLGCDPDHHRRARSPAPTPGSFTQTFDTKNVGTAKTLTPAGSVTTATVAPTTPSPSSTTPPV